MLYSQNINLKKGDKKMNGFGVSEFLVNSAAKTAKKMADAENILAIDKHQDFFVARDGSYDTTTMIAVHHFTTDDGKKFNIIMARQNAR